MMRSVCENGSDDCPGRGRVASHFQIERDQFQFRDLLQWMKVKNIAASSSQLS